ncbi:substrate-binding periplasmic protein [Arthrobacter sp. JCM 19049]|uniref:substrate-binding periplasmic protein n=1 Tax=Arthrobacter sp. JCM 19049 TaxID=1460643 RepID=UPI000AD285FA
MTSNKADAALGNQSVLRYAIADKPDFEVVQEIQTGEKLGVAVPKDSAELLDKVNSTLDRLKSSGDLDKMTDKWLGQK